MTNEEKFRKLVRGIIEEVLDEISTTAGAGPYQTPFAYKKKDDDEDEDEVKEEQLEEGKTRYHKLKSDQSRTAKQKIGESIREAKKSIREVKKILKVISRYKNEFGYSHESYWKTTQKDIYKMEQDLIAISQKLRELRS